MISFFRTDNRPAAATAPSRPLRHSLAALQFVL